MIRPLRQRHRVMVCALGVLLPVAFGAGIAARKPVPTGGTVESVLTGSRNDYSGVVWTKTDLWPGQRIITSLRRDDRGLAAVEFVFRDLAKPDVLLYWMAGNEMAVKGLPGNARLFGAFSNRAPLPLPAEVRGQAGRFVLYSLADHEVVAASKLFIIQAI